MRKGRLFIRTERISAVFKANLLIWSICSFFVFLTLLIPIFDSDISYPFREFLTIAVAAIVFQILASLFFLLSGYLGLFQFISCEGAWICGAIVFSLSLIFLCMTGISTYAAIFLPIGIAAFSIQGVLESRRERWPAYVAEYSERLRYGVQMTQLIAKDKSEPKYGVLVGKGLVVTVTAIFIGGPLKNGYFIEILIYAIPLFVIHVWLATEIVLFRLHWQKYWGNWSLMFEDSGFYEGDFDNTGNLLRIRRNDKRDRSMNGF